METLLLQMEGGDWLPFLVLLVAMLLIIKGTEVLSHHVRKFREKKGLTDPRRKHHVTE